MAKVSVVIPCYCAEEYIERCLLSLSHQTFTDFDVILVDDCSPDRTIETAMRVISKKKINVKVLRNNKNLGPSFSRRNGIYAAESEYIAFCDADDWYENDFLELMIDYSENERNEVVFCNYKSVYSNGKESYHNTVQPLRNLSKNRLIGQSPDSLCCMMVRRSILRSVVFPNIRNGEDMAIIPIIVASANTFGFVDECIYNYNCHIGSLSKEYSSTMIDSLESSFLYIEERIGQEYFEETEFLGIRNYLYGSILNLLKASFDRKKAVEILRKFEDRYPNWEKNAIFYSLPIYKKAFLKAVKKRLFVTCYILSQIHKRVAK